MVDMLAKPRIDGDVDAGAKWHILKDQSINQAPKYLDPIDQPNGISIHLFQGSIKWKDPRFKLDGQDEFKINVRTNYDCSELIEKSSQINSGPFGSVQLVNPAPNMPNNSIEVGSRLVTIDPPELGPNQTQSRWDSHQTSLVDILGRFHHPAGPTSPHM